MTDPALPSDDESRSIREDALGALNEIQAHLEADAAQKKTRGLISGPDFLRYVEEVRAGLDLLDQLLAVVGQSRPRK